MAVQHHWTD